MLKFRSICFEYINFFYRQVRLFNKEEFLIADDYDNIRLSQTHKEMDIMKYHTDLDNIKETSKLICKSVPIKPLFGGIIASHSFTNTCNWYNPETGEWLDLTKKDGFNKWTESLFKYIDEAENVWKIYFIVNAPYKLVMIKYWKDDLCLEDFTKLFKDAWILSENPNDDINVPVDMLIRWFKKADKRILMNNEELEVVYQMNLLFIEEWEERVKETEYHGLEIKKLQSGL